MKISKKAYYGLRAAIALAQSETALSIHALAQTEHLPEDYLEKILQILRRSGIVEARKGTDGGYLLARPARKISVWDILRELDGPMKTFALPSPPAGGGSLPCFQVSHCQSNQVWRTLEEKIEKTLSGITLETLTKQAE